MGKTLNVNNPFIDRFRKIVSDPLNEKIHRVTGAGQNYNDEDKTYLLMYNGIKVYPNCYYGQFSEILSINGGVHEPSEEFVFQEILKQISNEKPVMYELGAYWSFYSMSFIKHHPNAYVLCVEAGRDEIEIGKKNMILNNFTANFVCKKVGLSNDCWSVDKNLQHSKIDLLHSDIQGYELEMLYGAYKTLKQRQIDYIFVSTHSQILHLECLQFLNAVGYHIVADVDFENTFCEDGIIVAQNPELPKIFYALPKLSEYKVISVEDFFEKFNK
jgi:hypothetical protein